MGPQWCPSSRCFDQDNGMCFPQTCTVSGPLPFTWWKPDSKGSYAMAPTRSEEQKLLNIFMFWECEFPITFSLDVQSIATRCTHVNPCSFFRRRDCCGQQRVDCGRCKPLEPFFVCRGRHFHWQPLEIGDSNLSVAEKVKRRGRLIWSRCGSWVLDYWLWTNHNVIIYIFI